jgi:L-gulonolactone oxidase
MFGNRWRNWGRNQSCSPAAIEEPESELEVVEAVGRARAAGQAVKVVGAGHSFSDIACTDGRLLRLDRLDRIVSMDRETGSVTVEGGIPLWKLNEELAQRGLALSNLGDIDRQSISGAVSTATHGGGARFGGLATFVTGLELVTAAGEVVQCSAEVEPELFACARVSLGALGVITKVTLQCEPAFRLHAVERPCTVEELVRDLDEIADANEHIDCYWFPHTDVATVKVANRTDAPVRAWRGWKRYRNEVLLPNHVYAARCAVGRMRPGRIPANMQRVAAGIGRSQQTDVSHRILCSRRLVRFVEMEYAVPRSELTQLLLQVRDLIETEGLRVDFPVEVRVAAADDIPLSTAHGRATGYLAVHLSAGTPRPRIERYFRGVEGLMLDAGGRPHWGKLHFQDAAGLSPRYPDWDRFRRVRTRVDPDGRFRNRYLDRVLGPP